MPRMEVSPNRCDALGWLRASETGWMMGQAVSRGEESILGSWDGDVKGQIGLVAAVTTLTSSNTWIAIAGCEDGPAAMSP